MGPYLHEVVVEKLVPGGDGLARLEGRAVFIPFAAVGDRLRIELTAEKRDFARARILKVLTPSAQRVTPACPFFGECGGCNLQHLSYQEQLKQKLRMAREALERTAKLPVSDLPVESSIVACLPYGYRNRVQLHRDGRGRIGFMRRASNSLVEVAHCPVCVEGINRFLADPVPPAGAGRFQVFSTGDQCVVEGREEAVRLSLLGRRISFRLSGFFQSNLSILPALIGEVTGGLSGERLLDLYGGVGLFACFLRDSFHQVAVVEQNASALSMAEENLQGGRSSLFCSSVEEWIRAAGRHQAADAVVLDPPRSGLSATVRSFLLAIRPRAIRYVSCDPITLARDLAALCAGGYRLESLKLFDFFPQTAHIEAAAGLSAGGDSPSASADA